MHLACPPCLRLSVSPRSFAGRRARIAHDVWWPVVLHCHHASTPRLIPLVNCNEWSTACSWLWRHAPVSFSSTIKSLRPNHAALFHLELRSPGLLDQSSTVIVSHHLFVAPFKSSSLSSSASSFVSWLCWKVRLSKSRSSRIVSLPELRDSATYTLNRLNPPVGGIAMSTMTRFNV
ncbi:unnamed protein product [Mycena citricolor]|uniref:Uncharacterized protein n=1 Tax=Mycena citricolor TaxID=2018698 RepID=A0AAD2GYW1_9AGAR|nr:unnamed protein product [Mycena citricolor]